MKFLVGTLMMGLLLTGSTFAADAQKVNGYLVDVACASENAKKPKAGFASKHSKECLQMAECEGSGYSIVTAGDKVIKLDAKGNETARKLIAASKKDNDFKASATGKLDGDTLTVESLTLQ